MAERAREPERKRERERETQRERQNSFIIDLLLRTELGQSRSLRWILDWTASKDAHEQELEF